MFSKRGRGPAAPRGYDVGEDAGGVRRRPCAVRPGEGCGCTCRRCDGRCGERKAAAPRPASSSWLFRNGVCPAAARRRDAPAAVSSQGRGSQFSLARWNTLFDKLFVLFSCQFVRWLTLCSCMYACNCNQLGYRVTHPTGSPVKMACKCIYACNWLASELGTPGRR
jgi:hypothetical protein